MKRTGILGVLSILIFSTALSAQAQTTRIGVIDMQQVSEKYERYSQAAGILEARKAELQKVVDEEEQEVLSMVETLEQIRATASNADIERRRTTVEEKDKELREFVTSTNRQFRRDLETLQLRTRDEVSAVVTQLSQDKNLGLVLEKSMALYVSENLDITDEIVKALNDQFKPLPANEVFARPQATTTRAPKSDPTAFPSSDQPARGQWPFR